MRSQNIVIGICDDNIKQVDNIKNIVADCMRSNGIACQIQTAYNSKDFLQGAENYDIALLDIELQEAENGVDIGKKLREKNKWLPIIYITGYDNYKDYAFDVHCFQYLGKPVDEIKLKKVLKDALRAIDAQSVVLVFNTNNDKISLHLNDILFFEGKICGALLHTTNHLYKIKHSLAGVKKMVGDYDFYRIHKTYLINLKYAKKMHENKIVMVNEQMLSVSERRMQDFKRALIRFVCGED